MTGSIGRAMNGVEWLLLLTLALLWGGVFFFGKVMLNELPPFTAVLGRVALGALILLLLGATGGRLPRDLRTCSAFLVMGALNNVMPFSLIMWGQTQIASGLAAILNAATPLFTVLLAHALTADEKLRPGRLLGVLLGLGGVATLAGPAALAGLGGDLVAELACVAATISYGLAGMALIGLGLLVIDGRAVAAVARRLAPG